MPDAELPDPPTPDVAPDAAPDALPLDAPLLDGPPLGPTDPEPAVAPENPVWASGALLPTLLGDVPEPPKTPAPLPLPAVTPDPPPAPLPAWVPLELIEPAVDPLAIPMGGNGCGFRGGSEFRLHAHTLAATVATAATM